MLRIFIAVCLLMHASAFCQTIKVSPEKIRSLDSLLKIQFTPADPGSIVLIAKDGKVFYRKASGMSNMEQNIALQSEHKMGIGSISKQFAAVSILLLQQDGKLNIKDDIRKYLPSYNTYGRLITIENILSHTSGIPSYTELADFDSIINRTISNHQLVKFFESRPLVYEPGTNWSYSNSGYVLAALIVEKLSGLSFNDFLQQRIFKPLMMNETQFGSSDFLIAGKTGEYSGPTPKGRIKMETQYNWYWAYGAGQIVSTVDDMLKWDEGLYDPSFLRPELLELAHKSFILKSGEDAHYGLGWALDNLQNKDVVRHGGSIGGYRAEAVRIPADHLYLIILSNNAATGSALLANRMLTILYDLPALKEEKSEQQNWKEIEGQYASPNSGLRLQANFGPRPAFYTLRVDSSNRVTAQRTGGTAFPLSPAGKDLLFDKNNPYVAWKIQRNATGIVEGIQFQHYFPGYGPERYNKRVSNTIPSLPTPVKRDSASLGKFTGAYQHSNGDRVFLSIQKDQLYIEAAPLGIRTNLHWLNANTFWIKETNTEVDFETDKKGQVTGYRFYNGFTDNHFSKVNEIY